LTHATDSPQRSCAIRRRAAVPFGPGVT